MWIVLLAACTRPAPEVEAHNPRRNVLLVVIDTLRHDAAERADTPALRALEKNGDAVETAWASSTWTVPSMISMFTGMSVRQHGWNREPGNVADFPKIPEAPMLAEVLKRKGFRTTALYANDFLDPALGFDRGFETYRKTLDAQAPARVREVVSGWDPADRNFLYVHLLGPHSPLKPSEPKRQRYGVDPEWIEAHPLGFMIGAAKRNQTPGVRAAYREAYHAVVEDADARLGEILAALGPHRDDTLIVVTSDHGEMLGDHGMCGHGWFVWEELAHVPLVVEGAVPLPEQLSGASIPALITRSLGLDTTWPTPHDATLLVSQRKDKLAISEDGAMKAIWTEQGAEAFDHRTDRAETKPLPIPESLTAARERFEASVPAGTFSDEEVRLHDDTVGALKALGYLDASEEE